MRFSATQLKQIRRAHSRGGRVAVRLGVVATDAAGNSTKRGAPPIALRR